MMTIDIDMKIENNFKKYQCWKCGHIIKAWCKPYICVQPMSFRTYDICGGGYEELERWKVLKNKKR